MSYSAKKTFTNPIWVPFVGLFILAGCQLDITMDEGSASGEIALRENSGSTDDTQGTASQSGSEESSADEPDSEENLAGDSPEEESSTEDELVDESSPGSGGDEPSVDTMATLMWDAPGKRENGDTLKVGEIDYYIVSWGEDPDSLANTEEVACVNCTDMEHVVEDLEEGTWYFTVQTRDTEGNVSRQADLATKKI